MSKFNYTKEDFVTRIIVLAEFEYEDHHYLFNTKEEFAEHLISRFREMTFHDDDAALFGSRERLLYYLNELLPMVADKLWKETVQTSATRKRRKPPPPPVKKIEPSTESFKELNPRRVNLNYNINDMNSFVNTGYKLNWGNYTSVCSRNLNPMKADDRITYLMKNPQENAMIQWSFNQLEKDGDQFITEKHQMTCDDDKADQLFQKANVEVIKIPHTAKLLEYPRHYLFVNSGFGMDDTNLGITINFILYDKDTKDQIGGCTLGFSWKAFRNAELEKETGAMIDLFETNMNENGKGHGKAFLSYIFAYVKREFGINRIFAVGILPPEGTQKISSAMKFWRYIGMSGSLNFPPDMQGMYI